MRILVFTLGTRGDFELFLSLACELKRRGHAVDLAAQGFYAERAHTTGIEATVVGTSTRGQLLDVLRSHAAVSDPTQRVHEFYARWMRPELAASMDRVTALAIQTDYFVSNLKMTLPRGDTVIPCAAVTYDPPASEADVVLAERDTRPDRILRLVAMTRRLVDPGETWAPSQHFTGFWRGEPWPSFTPPRALAEFLRGGSPPVVVTMGSMLMFDAARFATDVTEALRFADQRGVIVSGWPESSFGDLGADWIHVTSEVPYEWLLPQASCVIHHGGCGTIGSVLRAGRPSILLPQIKAQEMFAEMLMRERLATGIFDVRALDRRDLASAIRRAVSDERVRDAARSWQRIVDGERGIAAAADLIEAHGAAIAAA